MSYKELTPSIKKLLQTDAAVRQAVFKHAIASNPSLSEAFNNMVNSHIDFVKKAKEANNGWPIINIAKFQDDPTVPLIPVMAIGAYAEDPETVGNIFLGLFEADKPLKEEIEALTNVVKAYHNFLPK